MNNSFQKVIADLNTALRNPVPCEIGGKEDMQVWIYPCELEALIQCAKAVDTCSFFDAAAAKKAIEECDRG